MVKKSIWAPAWKFYFGYPLLFAFQYAFFSLFYNLHGVIPPKYLRGTSLDIALRFMCLVSLPIVVQVASIMLYRASTVFAETLHKEEETIYLRTSKMALTNTTEQTIIFALNILAAASLGSVTAERLAMHCVVFALSRFLFWVLYIIGAYFDFTALRALGFAMTFINSNLVLLGNIVTFFSIS